MSVFGGSSSLLLPKAFLRNGFAVIRFGGMVGAGEYCGDEGCGVNW